MLEISLQTYTRKFQRKCWPGIDLFGLVSPIWKWCNQVRSLKQVRRGQQMKNGWNFFEKFQTFGGWGSFSSLRGSEPEFNEFTSTSSFKPGF